MRLCAWLHAHLLAADLAPPPAARIFSFVHTVSFTEFCGSETWLFCIKRRGRCEALQALTSQLLQPRRLVHRKEPAAPSGAWCAAHQSAREEDSAIRESPTMVVSPQMFGLQPIE